MKVIKWILTFVSLVLIAYFGFRYIPPLIEEYTDHSEVFLNVANYNQNPDYPTGCESVSLYLLLQYYGVDVSVDDIVEVLPKGPVPYEEDGELYGANPDREFVGDPRDEDSYGVYNKPICSVANEFRKGAKTRKGAMLGDVMKVLKKGNPVMVWFTTDTSQEITYSQEWLDYKTKKHISWPKGEHAVVVYGFDSDNIYYSDPNTGENASVSRSVFRKYFRELGGRMVYYNE